MTAPHAPTRCARLFRPARARLDDARAAVAGAATPADAWAALATRGVIPPAWVSSPTRRFTRAAPCACGARATFCPYCSRLEDRALPHPPTVDDGVVLAADADVLDTVEALARQFAERLAPWEYARRAQGPAVPVLRTLWVLGTTPAIDGIDDTVLGDVAWSRVGKQPAYAVSDAADRARAALPRGDDLAQAAGVPHEYLVDVQRARCWEAACAARWTVPPWPRGIWEIEQGLVWPDALAGQRFAELPAPFDPLVEIWRLGYALATANVDADAGADVVLVALGA